jgi:hypothetical protein
MLVGMFNAVKVESVPLKSDEILRRPNKPPIPTELIPQAADPPAPAEIRDAVLGVATDPEIRLRLEPIREELYRVGGSGHAADAV